MLKSLPQSQNIMLQQTLRKTSMFSGLNLEWIARIAEGCKLLPLAKSNFLFHQGEKVEGFYVVHSGAINVHRVTADGKEQVIRIFYPRESFGEVVLAEGQSYPASAMAIENSQVILIPKIFFLALIRRDPDLALRILGSISLHLRFLVETIEDLKLKQAESRVVQWLLRKSSEATAAGNITGTIEIPMAKRLLASQLGITSETFSRVLAHLRDEQLITIDGKEITLLDTAKLTLFASSQPLAGVYPNKPAQRQAE